MPKEPAPAVTSLPAGDAGGRPLSATSAVPTANVANPPERSASQRAQATPDAAAATAAAAAAAAAAPDEPCNVGRAAGDVELLELEQQQQPSPLPSAAISGPIPTGLAARLYTSHFLSTWNSRLFEFASVLFLAAIFPGTLLPLSVYAVVRGVAAIVFAEAVGAWIDRGDRLAVVRASIIGGRAAVVLSCGVFWLLLLDGRDNSRAARTDGLFALAVICACVEKLCSVMNLVAIERDWVVVITEGNEVGRRVLNARMRRIDLFCKLVAPLCISLVALASTWVALWVTLGINAVSVVVEYFCIAVVYRRVPELRRQPVAWDDNPSTAGPRQISAAAALVASMRAVGRKLLPFSSLPLYFRHPAFLPSFSLALLYLTVLSFAGQFVTFLLAVGYNSLYVGLARTISTACELSATWIAPRLMARVGVVRAGIWSLSWQVVWLTAGVAWFFAAAGGTDSIAAATGLAVGVALSRVGLWGYDLSAQNIVQDEVEPAHRGAFSTAEAAFQNLFDVLSYVTTIVFARPDQFKWPVVISAAAVYAAALLYTGFVRQRRGHLFHSPLPPAQRWLEKTLVPRHGRDTAGPV